LLEKDIVRETYFVPIVTHVHDSIYTIRKITVIILAYASLAHALAGGLNGQAFPHLT
jgi:hypothetical protein